jgi:peptidoglycan-associated lipoprotein
MKSVVLSGVLASLLMLSGCSDKAPVVDEMPQPPVAKKEPVKQEVSVVEPVATEEISNEDSMVDSMSNEMKMSNLESKMATIYFDFDKFEINAKNTDKLSSDAAIANGNAKSFNIKLEGNCDEWGSDEYNFALGLKRANSVKDALVAEGVDASRISMVSYGESNPVCNDKTEDCWSKNRRVNFALLP